MDGVLTNFDERFFDLKGMPPGEFEDRYGREEFWNFIDREVGVKFWSDMQWTPKGRELWEFIKPYKPELLTSPSRDENSRLGKALWVRNNLNPLPKINYKYSKEKQEYATPTSIHIDDRKDIIKRWEKAGGIGIHHPKNTTNIIPIINKLKDLGYE